MSPHIQYLFLLSMRLHGFVMLVAKQSARFDIGHFA